MTNKEDSVKVIRCKDCKYMEEYKLYGHKESAYRCPYLKTVNVYLTDYCSRAVRKAD